jgi:hypothetical protein
VGVVFAGASILLARRQLQRDFEDFYVKRYWQIMDDYSLEGLLGDPRPQSRRASTNDDERTALRYLMLCEDEIDVYRNRYISRKTWDLWRKAILNGVERSPVKEVWDSLQQRSMETGHQHFEWLPVLIKDKAVPQIPRRDWFRGRLRRGAPGEASHSESVVGGR